MSAAGSTPADGIRAITDEEVAAYRENGWVYLPALFSRALVDEVLERSQAKMGADAKADLDDNRGTIMSPQLAALWQNWQNPSEHDDFFRTVARSRQFGQLAARLMDGRQARYWSDTVMCKLPASDGGSKTPWHQDFPYHSQDRHGILNVWAALVDVPPEMGSLRFLNGSHRAGPMGRVVHRTDGVDLLDLFPWLADEYELSEPLHMRAGDATVHNLMTIHAAAQNDTEELRWAYVTSLFPSDSLFTGAQQRRTDGLGLRVNEPFDNPRFELLPS
ncbi:MAG TPA: phytanoyl-CoA dioxygenase family protein [Conexibacter sp.]|jgi:ectoine hydroxylase-related dioxygenase (phytanoyl-CoA dioxygenase family)